MRSGPSTNNDIVGVISANESISANTRNDAGDWVQVEFNTEAGTEIGWVFVSLFTVNGDVNSLPIFNPDAPLETPDNQVEVSEANDEQSLYLIVPFHPDDPANGGEIHILISNGVSECDPISLFITPLPDSSGAFERVIALTGEMLALRREEMGVTRDALLAVEPAELAPTLVSLAISQRLYDGPDNPESLVAMQAQLNNGTYTDDDIRLLDVIIGRTGVVTYLETQIANQNQQLEAQFGNARARPPIHLMDAQGINIELTYPNIENAADLSREMLIATSADFALNRGATGQVLSDLGVVTAIGGLVSSSNPIMNFVFTTGGNLIYVEKSRLELEAYTGPVRFVSFEIEVDPHNVINNENSTSDVTWAVTATVESQQWDITRARAYDATRFFSQGVSLPGPVDTAGGVLDVITAVCDRDSNPCGERPIAVSIPPHRWTINNMDQYQYFEVSRERACDPCSYVIVDNSTHLRPVNAGTTGLTVSAPRSQFGLYQGDGFDNEYITVNEIDINIQQTGISGDLVLDSGEILNVCYMPQIIHAIQEDGRNDLSYEVSAQGQGIIDVGEVNRNEELCFNIGPIEPAEWVECELQESFQYYTIELESLAENGPRGGSDWHRESRPLERTESFYIRVDAEEPERPDECEREGVWYLVISTIDFTCSGIAMNLPVSGEPIPLTVDTLNAGTSVFGMLDQVLTTPGASLLPPSVASDIAEADATADDLQTTEEELDPAGRLFTSIPDIAQEGATYIEVFPVDPSGAVDGEVLLELTFTTDTTFTGQMAMTLIIPNVGECDVDVPLEGYFEPSGN